MISSIGIPELITVPVSKNLFCITPLNGEMMLVCSNLTLKNSYCDSAIIKSDLALSRS